MKLGSLVSFLFFFTSSHAQLEVSKRNMISIPSTIIYDGKLAAAASWEDKAGKHLVITSEVLQDSRGSADNQDASVYAYHYTEKRGDTIKLLWKVYDYVKDCPVDIKAQFIKNTFAVTDLDKNGEAEVWLMYKTYCRGDIGPSEMKIIMYEENRKYAIRGRTRVWLSESKKEGGDYVFDDAFNSAPAVFKAYARGLWERNRNETWD